MFVNLLALSSEIGSEIGSEKSEGAAYDERGQESVHHSSHLHSHHPREPSLLSSFKVHSGCKYPANPKSPASGGKSEQDFLSTMSLYAPKKEVKRDSVSK